MRGTSLKMASCDLHLKRFPASTSFASWFQSNTKNTNMVYYGTNTLSKDRKYEDEKLLSFRNKLLNVSKILLKQVISIEMHQISV